MDPTAAPPRNSGVGAGAASDPRRLPSTTILTTTTAGFLFFVHSLPHTVSASPQPAYFKPLFTNGTNGWPCKSRVHSRFLSRNFERMNERVIGRLWRAAKDARTSRAATVVSPRPPAASRRSSGVIWATGTRRCTSAARRDCWACARNFTALDEVPTNLLYPARPDPRRPWAGIFGRLFTPQFKSAVARLAGFLAVQHHQ